MRAVFCTLLRVITRRTPALSGISLGPVVKCGSTTALYTGLGGKGKKEALLFTVRPRSQADPSCFWLLLSNLRTDECGTVLTKLMREARLKNAKTLAGKVTYDLSTLVPLSYHYSLHSLTKGRDTPESIFLCSCDQCFGEGCPTHAGQEPRRLSNRIWVSGFI